MKQSINSGTNHWILGPDVGSYVVYYYTGSAYSGVYINNGANTWSALSDKRLKTFISDFNESTGISTIKQLSLKKFFWNSDIDKKEQIGFFAQDLLDIIPYSISKTKFPNNDTEYYGLDYDKINLYLLKAVQELIQKVESLEQEMALIKNK
ncbi:MAG: tail fiber domain-containing protein [Betaproteobacteria bacterium]|nr:tail fiber domain-containing protein [Betaproteobacteria bacterium]